MADPESGLPEIYLQPGEMFLAREPTMIATLLGSCVGVTFWCARLGLGALCHCLLPRCPNPPGRDASLATGYRYVDFCLRDLASQFEALGARRAEVEVKIFGGADVLFVADRNRRPTIGRLNSEAAVEVLADVGYRVAASSVGDTFGRRIRFNTGSGEVRLFRLG